jgi:hypothetical protein
VFLVKQPCECEPSFLHPPYCLLFLAICLINVLRSCGCSIFSSLGERKRGIGFAWGRVKGAHLVTRGFCLKECGIWRDPKLSEP